LSEQKTDKADEHGKRGLDGDYLIESEVEKQKAQEFQEKRKRSIHANLQLVFNGTLMFTTIILAILGKYQSDTSRISAEAAKSAAETASKTLKEMQTGSGATDTHNLAVAAGNQAEAATALAQRTKDLAARMKDQADRTKIIAEQAIIQAQSAIVAADASRSTAKTAINTLHVSERAYVVAGAPQLVIDRKMIALPLQNNWRIPSGPVELVAHELTVEADPAAGTTNLAMASEIHWKRSKFQTIIPNVPFLVEVPVAKMNPDQMRNGHQLVLIAGSISYRDGFEDTPTANWTFCVQSILHTTLKELTLTSCDPAEYLPKVEMLDGYPRGEQQQ
jgi:hypothetical protein